MPRIGEFYGIVIEMYYGDHPPPYFDARCGGDAAKIEIAGGEVIAGSLPSRALRLVPKWIDQHRDELGGQLGASGAPPEATTNRPTPVNEIIHVTDVEPLDGHRIRVTFNNGAVKEIDLGALLAAGGVFSSIYERREVFEKVAVNPESGTVGWPGEVDLDPEGSLRALRTRLRPPDRASDGSRARHCDELTRDRESKLSSRTPGKRRELPEHAMLGGST